ncbi:hypothetical protein D3C85_1703780 [compost metagenome]
MARQDRAAYVVAFGYFVEDGDHAAAHGAVQGIDGRAVQRDQRNAFVDFQGDGGLAHAGTLLVGEKARARRAPVACCMTCLLESDGPVLPCF